METLYSFDEFKPQKTALSQHQKQIKPKEKQFIQEKRRSSRNNLKFHESFSQRKLSPSINNEGRKLVWEGLRNDHLNCWAKAKVSAAFSFGAVEAEQLLCRQI